MLGTRHLDASAGVVRAAGEPWPQVLAAMPRMLPFPKVYAFDFEGVPWSQAMGFTGQTLAATRAGRVAIAVERWRRRHGRLPAALADLGSALPVDPFTGREFTYRRTAATYVVSSVGPERDPEAGELDESGRPQGVRVCLPSS